MRVSEFVDAFDQTLPLSLALADDAVGVQVLVDDRELSGVAVAYELDSDAVNRAADAGANLIIAFHPLIYSPLRRIGSAGRVERAVVALIDRRVGLLIVHTAFDSHPRGTSMLLGAAIGLRGMVPIVRHEFHTDAGMGAVGNLIEPIPLSELAERVRRTCGTEVVRVSEPPGGALTRYVKRVAIVGGSGMSYYDRAVAAGAEAFISADVRYHAFHSAVDSIPVLDPGHAESEAFVIDGIADLVRQTLERIGLAIDVIPLKESTNPVHYVVNKVRPSSSGD